MAPWACWQALVADSPFFCPPSAHRCSGLHIGYNTMHTSVTQQQIKCQTGIRQRHTAAFRPFQHPGCPYSTSTVQKPKAVGRRSSLLLTAGGGAGLWIAGGVVAAGAAAAAAGMFGGENPQALVRTGMQKFRKVGAPATGSGGQGCRSTMFSDTFWVIGSAQPLSFCRASAGSPAAFPGMQNFARKQPAVLQSSPRL